MDGFTVFFRDQRLSDVLAFENNLFDERHADRMARRILMEAARADGGGGSPSGDSIGWGGELHSHVEDPRLGGGGNERIILLPGPASEGWRAVHDKAERGQLG